MLKKYSRFAKRVNALIIGAMTVATMSSFQPVQVSAVTTGNGALVYSPDPAKTFDKAGTTYARLICLKNSGASNGTLLCTFDQLSNVNGKQVYPIYRSTDNGGTWKLIANVSDTKFNTTRTSQPCLFEVPQKTGDLEAGTILLAGNIFPEDKSSSRIVIYKSTDKGTTWSFLNTVDVGGPTLYDPSPTSTTTTIWEPFLGLDKSGNLICYYSDEREKSQNVLQALVHRASSDGGKTWGPVVNDVAIPNKSDRPGMWTCTKLPNGKYLATYEVVNRPSQKNNNAVVYYKLSEDGVNWNPSDLGTPIKLSDGRGIGSSPFVKWVPAGGANGTVIVAAKWGLDAAGNLSGGQNFYANTNLGQGSWEQLPMAVTYDAVDSVGYFTGFSQSIDTNVDNTMLYQATDVENLTTKRNDVRVGTRPLNAKRYEAENATLTNVKVESCVDGSGEKEARYINYADSSVKFQNINVPTSGTYTINVRYSNGTTANSIQNVKVNNGKATTLTYPVTANWDRYGWVSFTANLNAGNNTIEFGYNTSFAEIDCIEVYK